MKILFKASKAVHPIQIVIDLFKFILIYWNIINIQKLILKNFLLSRFHLDSDYDEEEEDFDFQQSSMPRENSRVPRNRHSSQQLNHQRYQTIH